MFILLLFGFNAVGQHKGSLTKRNFKVGDCQVAYMKVLYDIGSFFGEPTLKVSFEWQAGAGTDANCLNSSTTIWVKIANGGSYGWVRLIPDEIPVAGEGFGWNMLAASPDWDDFLCAFSDNQKTNCMNAESAKKLYKEGRVVEFKVGMNGPGNKKPSTNLASNNSNSSSSRTTSTYASSAVSASTTTTIQPNSATRKYQERSRLMSLGNQAAGNNQFQSALSYYQQAQQIEYNEGTATAIRGIQARIQNSTTNTSGQNADDLIRKGNTASINGNYQQAIGYFREAKRLKPNDPNIDKLISFQETLISNQNNLSTSNTNNQYNTTNSTYNAVAAEGYGLLIQGIASLFSGGSKKKYKGPSEAEIADRKRGFAGNLQSWMLYKDFGALSILVTDYVYGYRRGNRYLPGEYDRDLHKQMLNSYLFYHDGEKTGLNRFIDGKKFIGEGDQGVFKGYGAFGEYYRRLGDYDAANEYFKDAYKLGYCLGESVVPKRKMKSLLDDLYTTFESKKMAKDFIKSVKKANSCKSYYSMHKKATEAYYASGNNNLSQEIIERNLRSILISSAGGITGVYNTGKKHHDKKEYDQAFYWMQMAAVEGYQEAFAYLGYYYDTGKGVEIDDRKAMTWYKKAADIGSSWAMNNIGTMWEHGEGVERSELIAKRWYQKACGKGYKKGCENLAKLD
tara:strand:+ start:1956 stop:3989 length:2034 start_codon:yes stop_codon:yes gene_type:complete